MFNSVLLKIKLNLMPRSSGDVTPETTDESFFFWLWIYCQLFGRTFDSHPLPANESPLNIYSEYLFPLWLQMRIL